MLLRDVYWPFIKTHPKIMNDSIACLASAYVDFGNSQMHAWVNEVQIWLGSQYNYGWSCSLDALTWCLNTFRKNAFRNNEWLRTTFNMVYKMRQVFELWITHAVGTFMVQLLNACQCNFGNSLNAWINDDQMLDFEQYFIIIEYPTKFTW